ncbi:hypothetical protein RR48_14454 [Papilio machaon]|uniref:Uncharacterized protein n=1 Tax=Papilio machaon TaxID=76193 RepID=A0A194QKF4_PAPMA|nr:hypothetical protein RR48_14454 [Papilio machaon]
MTSFETGARVSHYYKNQAKLVPAHNNSDIYREHTYAEQYFKMYTNPFERKHSALRQALDRFIRGETRISFRTKKPSLKNNGSNSSIGSATTMDFNTKYNQKR